MCALVLKPRVLSYGIIASLPCLISSFMHQTLYLILNEKEGKQ